MTISYVQANPPLWYIVNDDGTAAGGAQMFTYDSLTRQPKVVYQDPAGINAWPNPVIFDLNGTKGPFYWKKDSASPGDLYFVEVFNAAGLKLWEANDFPDTASGGGSDITIYLPIVNYITNNQFINNIEAQAGPLPTNLVLAPSNHKGFTPALTNPVVGTYGVLGPDIRFVKNNTNAVDSITFPTFALADAPLTGDVTPVSYVRYQCTNSPASETYKSFQFPITQKVKNLSNTSVTFGVWAKVTATPVTINIYCRQYYGSGTGATAESSSTRTLQAAHVLTTDWTWYPTNFTVPDVAGNTLGTSGLQTDDDATYIQLDMPLGIPCDVLFIKPALFLGTVDPEKEFDSYDQIDSIDQTPRTGDIRVSYWTSAPQGWLAMDDTTIGTEGSGADFASQTAFQLYKTLWDAVDNAWAPVSTGRGASALSDFLAGKTLRMPKSLGRALAGAGTGSALPTYALGQASGAPTETLLATNLPPHTHTTTIPYSVVGLIDGPAGSNVRANNVNVGYVSDAGPGTSAPISILQQTSFMNVFIKL